MVIPSLRKFDHDVQHLLHHFGIKGAGRLIEEHHFRLHTKASGNGDTLLLAARKLSGVFCGLFGDMHLFEIIHGDVFGFGARELSDPDGAKSKVFQYRQMREKIEVLEHHADFNPDFFDILDIVGEFDIIDDNLSALMFLEAVDAPDQG